MLTYDYTKDLLNLQGVEVIKIEKSESKTLIYTQLPVKSHTCPCCSHQTTSVHDYRIRKIKDISAFGKYVILMHNHRRYVCKHCGKRFAEDNSFAPKYYRVTLRLIDEIFKKQNLNALLQVLQKKLIYLFQQLFGFLIFYHIPHPKNFLKFFLLMNLRGIPIRKSIKSFLPILPTER